jgi:hypothetical protein
MFYIQSRLELTWLNKFLSHVGKLKVNFLSRFMKLVLFALALAQANFVPFNVWIAILIIIVAYVLHGVSIGETLGRDVLLPVFNKFNVFHPSVDIPKEFKRPEWKL